MSTSTEMNCKLLFLYLFIACSVPDVSGFPLFGLSSAFNSRILELAPLLARRQKLWVRMLDRTGGWVGMMMDRYRLYRVNKRIVPITQRLNQVEAAIQQG